ncbi:MAG: hemerythrin domain-containing protein [Streptosporangiaceae bacterium]|nr:hemerythrin domain-containing protein [Streptosporangiaceae bacterium]MBV9857837.1 hemerythrin domain-containing protein [Streptosporangiaceae bacterium]
MPDVFSVLSKDHEEVKKMLATLEKNRGGSRGSSGRPAQRKKMVDDLITEESRHEAAEEMYFWPAVRDKLPDGDKLADKATGQEQEAKEVLDKLDKLGADDPQFEELLGEFIESGREHIQFEETQVWPNMRKALSKKEASDLGTKLQEAKKTAPTRPHPEVSPEALRRRAQGGGTARRAGGGTRAGSNGKAAAGQKTKAELYKEAQKLGVEGRSSMTKEELARQIAQRSR